MNYEKEYEEAVKRAKAMIKVAEKEDEVYKIAITIFPELKESEDERIRKALIDYFDDANKADENPLQSYGIHTDKAIAWLKKQSEQKPSEQKPIDKVEPKFNVGDWIVRGDTIAQILDIQEQYYVGLDINGKDFTSSRFLDDNKIHLWTIKDAKPGDVLADDNGFVMIVDESRDSKWGHRLSRHCAINSKNSFSSLNIHTKIDGLHPATKEQRDLLFHKYENIKRIC